MQRVNNFTKVLTEICSEARKFQTLLPKGMASKEYKSRVPCTTLNFNRIHMNLNQRNSLFKDLTELHLSYKINQWQKVEATI